MPFKAGDGWKAQVRKNGRRKEARFKTRKEALDWEAKYRGLPIEEWDTDRIPTVCLIDWATKYLDCAAVKFGDKTYREKRAMFRLLFQSVNPNLPVARLTPGDILAHLQKQAQGRSGYEANKDRKNLVAGWNWGIKYMGLPAPNPCLVDRFAEQRQRRYIPPISDFWKVYEAAETKQDRLMLLAYLHTAARRAELFRLCWTDVDFNRGELVLSTRKRMDGSLEYDELPMTDDLYAALLEHKLSSSSLHSAARVIYFDGFR